MKNETTLMKLTKQAPDFRALCAELADELDHYRQLLMDDRRETHSLANKARAALAEQPVVPTNEELMDLAEEAWVPFAKSQPHPQGHPWDLVLARAVLARWGQP